MKLTLLAFAILMTASFAVAQDQPKSSAPHADEAFLATVQVLAFETHGAFLGAPEVRLFESQDHKNISSSFRAGVADHVPFGVYRIEAYVGGFYPEVRYVAVYRQRVTVAVGLEFGREALTLPNPTSLHGKVIAPLPPAKKSLAKLTGLFSNRSLESSIDPNGEFDFSIPWEGRYLLLILNEDGVLASRSIDIPYRGPPIEIEIGQR
jgi:hypothetical protein